MTDLSLVLDDAAAEAKRRGHAVITPAHLAVALAQKFPAETSAAWHTVLPDAERELAALPVTYDRPREDSAVQSMASVLRNGDLAALLTTVEQAVLSAAPPPPETSEISELPDHAGGPTGEATPQDTFPIPEAHRDYVNVIAPDSDIVGRESVVGEILDAIDLREPKPVLLAGEEGSGKTAIAGALAAALAGRGIPVLRIDNAAAPAERHLAALSEMLRLTNGRALLFLDDLEVALALGYPSGFSGPYLAALRPALESTGTRLVAVVGKEYRARFQDADKELTAEFVPVELPILPPEVLQQIVTERTKELAEYHRVVIPADVITAALAPKQEGEKDAHPGLALRRIDVAATRAARRAAQHAQSDQEPASVLVTDLPLSPPIERRVDPSSLAAALGQHIVGQDRAIEAVTSRLSITVAQLDLNPLRPDGVFLFAGPTGVGKTALALALARELFGSVDAVVRIDMSELHDDYTTSRLVGAPPGYIGYDQPDGWLTTQIRQRPRCVLLLDEIEKAAPRVWNTFLQVFDAGRLTDLRGTTADFREVVIVMTTNIGAEAFSARAHTGFIDIPPSASADVDAVMSALKRTMRPELLNRIDEILVFSPLSTEAVHAIATMRTQKALATLRGRGYTVEATAELIDVIERVGFSREYGGREVLRTVERLILEPLAAQPPGAYTPVVDGDHVTWVPA